MLDLGLILAQGGGGSGVSIGQVIVYGVIGVVFISTMIKNIIKENQKKQRQRDANANAGASQANGGASLDEIAAQRRAQLQEMARQRRGGAASGGGGGRPSASQPQASAGGDANLSMAERIARARAAQQSQRQSTPRPVPSVDPRQERAEALRERILRRQQQQREALAARQRQAEQKRAQQAARRARPVSPQSPPRRELPPVQTPHPVSVEPHAEVHRTVEDAATKAIGSKRRKKELAARKTPALIDFDKLTKADLRRAFVLKEILDRPVAERDPLADAQAG